MRVHVQNIHQLRTRHGYNPEGVSILEPVRIPPTDSFGMGDFVPGLFALPQNPVVYYGEKGMGDFVPGLFVVPQNPVRDAEGMSGCGCGGGCGPCRGDGMGAIDWSPSSTSIVSSLGITSVQVPNWGVYAVVGGIILVPLLAGKRRRGR